MLSNLPISHIWIHANHIMYSIIYLARKLLKPQNILLVTIFSSVIFLVVTYSQLCPYLALPFVRILRVSDKKIVTELYINETVLYPEPFTLANVANFTFILNEDICQQQPVDLLLLIGSHPKHFHMRKVLRESWGSPRHDNYTIKLMFPMGIIEDVSLNQKVLKESEAFEDIVQGSFPDAYGSLTIRDLMSFHWTWTQCPQARFVMHIDDDMCMDIDHVLDALEEQMPKDREYVACFSFIAWGWVARTGRHGLTKEEYPNIKYDSYCSGWAYWLTPIAAKYLELASARHHPYRMNDAYLTGTLMSELGWRHLKLRIETADKAEDLQNDLHNCNFSPKYFMGRNGHNTTLARLVHARYRRYSLQNGFPRHGKKV